MDKFVADYLMLYAERMQAEADMLFLTTPNLASASSIIRQAAWKIEGMVPKEYRAERLTRSSVG